MTLASKDTAARMRHLAIAPMLDTDRIWTAQPTGRAVPPPEDDDAYAPLADMMDEFVRELEADGLAVAWQVGDQSPQLLFTCGDSCSDLLIDDHRPCRRHNAGSVPEASWRTIDEAGTIAGVMTATIPAGNMLVTMTTAFREIEGSTRNRVRETMRRMLPMIQGFFRMWSLRSLAVAKMRSMTAAVENSDTATLLLDGTGEITFANAAATRLLNENDGIRRTGRTVGCTRLADTLRLQASIEHVLSGDDFGGGWHARAPIVALHRRDRRPLMAAVVPTGQSGEKNAAVIYVFDPSQNLHPLVEPVCAFYRLTPVETRLTCLLADGMSLADAAAAIHVREQTARSYLKQIFLKTDTKRQGELVWLMLRSSVRTAPLVRAEMV
jgi:DNA-binding CsgD family transcriptional regulator/PAS domain-containing protein